LSQVHLLLLLDHLGTLENSTIYKMPRGKKEKENLRINA